MGCMESWLSRTRSPPFSQSLPHMSHSKVDLLKSRFLMSEDQCFGENMCFTDWVAFGHLSHPQNNEKRIERPHSRRPAWRMSAACISVAKPAQSSHMLMTLGPPRVAHDWSSGWSNWAIAPSQSGWQDLGFGADLSVAEGARPAGLFMAASFLITLDGI